MQPRSDWIHVLDVGEVAEVLAAVEGVRRSGIDWLDLDKEDFPLPRMATRLARVAQQLERGCGIAVVRGIPHEALGQAGMRIAMWGIGLHLGTAVSQSKYGELLAEGARLRRSHGSGDLARLPRGRLAALSHRPLRRGGAAVRAPVPARAARA
jgi:hypothetical protein